MSWESALQAVTPLQSSMADLAPVLQRTSLNAETSFGHMVSSGISSINRELLASQIESQHLAAGDVQNLHQVMIRLEESQLSFQLFMQVRNRLLEAYQDVMKMQV